MSSTTHKAHEGHAFQPFGDMCVYIYVFFFFFWLFPALLRPENALYSRAEISKTTTEVPIPSLRSSLYLLFGLSFCKTSYSKSAHSVIRISNALRAYRPVELQDPMVSFSISGITLTYVGQSSTITEGLEFTKQLLLAFLLGFAIATGVSLFILPITSRRNVFKEVKKYVVIIQVVLKARADYLEASQDHLLQKEKSLKMQGTMSESPEWGPDARC